MIRLSGAAAFAVAVALVATSVAGCGDTRGDATAQAAQATQGASAAPMAAAALQRQYEDVIETVLPSVVQISTPDAQGSGVVYDDKGDIVTNAHVVGTAKTVQVLTDVGGVTMTARVVGLFAPDDLAVIRVTAGAGSLRPARFGRSAGIRAGQIVLALGSPLGLTGSATQGIISATGRTLIESIPTGTGAAKTTTIADVLQTSAAINSGNSGGALVSLSGQVIGVPTATAGAAGYGSATGIGFAIPSDTVTSIARQLIANGRVARPGQATLGISPAAATSSGQATGVTIAAVAQGGPAAAAGLRPGDVIADVEGCPVRTEAELTALLAALAPGMQLALTYLRSGRAYTATATLAASWG